MEIEDFSAGYYRLSIQVEEWKDGPTISCGLYDYINSNFYTNTDADPLFRLGTSGEPYFKCSCEVNIPDDVLGIPKTWFDDADFEYALGEQYIYLCKQEYSHVLGNSMLTGTIDDEDRIDVAGALDLDEEVFEEE